MNNSARMRMKDHRAVIHDRIARLREVEDEALLVCGSTLYNPYRDRLSRRRSRFWLGHKPHRNSGAERSRRF